MFGSYMDEFSWFRDLCNLPYIILSLIFVPITDFFLLEVQMATQFNRFLGLVFYPFQRWYTFLVKFWSTYQNVWLFIICTIYFVVVNVVQSRLDTIFFEFQTLEVVQIVERQILVDLLKCVVIDLFCNSQCCTTQTGYNIFRISNFGSCVHCRTIILSMYFCYLSFGTQCSSQAHLKQQNYFLIYIAEQLKSVNQERILTKKKRKH
eukprot:TRINITY_DN8590_c0_g2_i7.p3 TRINITY_DN8590_c0_g2~~TRINITY_DN8590_c0_g2_i7.p3  ORF type:complete len:206 (+),score=-4.17 TRINITY_DN8590_c0_g2_i7:567-1184(+)